MPFCRRSFCSTKQRASLLLSQIAPNFPKQVFKYSAKSRGYLRRNGNNKNLRAAAGHQRVSFPLSKRREKLQQQRRHSQFGVVLRKIRSKKSSGEDDNSTRKKTRFQVELSSPDNQIPWKISAWCTFASLQRVVR